MGSPPWSPPSVAGDAGCSELPISISHNTDSHGQGKDTSPPAPAEMSVQQWCQAQGLDSPADLRFAFASLEEAQALANPAVVQAWRELSRMTAGALPSAWGLWHRSSRAAQNAIMPLGGRPPVAPVVQAGVGRSALRKRLFKRESDRRESNPEQTAIKRAAVELLALALTWPTSRYARAKADLTRHEVKSWRASALAEIEAMGPIHTRLGAWRTWCAWCQDQGVAPIAASEAELRRFVYRPTARESNVNAPRSRWDLLNWFRLHLGAPVPTDLLARPPAKRRPGGRRAAVAADPEIFLVCDQVLADMDSSHEQYVFGIAHVVLYQATMRCRHCIRSVIQSLGSHLITFACLYGKKRGGWTWQLPRYTPSGVDLGAYLWAGYAARAAGEPKAPVGIFSDPGSPGPLEYVEIMKGCREFLTSMVGLADSQRWTTYSARKAIPTILDILEAPDHTRKAAGHWADEDSCMPVRYSAARMATSTIARAEAIKAIVVARSHVPNKLSWEALEGAKHSFDYPVVKKAAARLVADNVQVAALSASQLVGVAPEAPRFNLARMARALRPGLPAGAARRPSMVGVQSLCAVPESSRIEGNSARGRGRPLPLPPPPVAGANPVVEVPLPIQDRQQTDETGDIPRRSVIVGVLYMHIYACVCGERMGWGSSADGGRHRKGGPVRALGLGPGPVVWVPGGVVPAFRASPQRVVTPPVRVPIRMTPRPDGLVAGPRGYGQEGELRLMQIEAPRTLNPADGSCAIGSTPLVPQVAPLMPP